MCTWCTGECTFKHVVIMINSLLLSTWGMGVGCLTQFMYICYILHGLFSGNLPIGKRYHNTMIVKLDGIDIKYYMAVA